MNSSFGRSRYVWLFLVLVMIVCGYVACAKALEPGQVIKIRFTDRDLPPTLYAMMNKATVEPCLSVRLPDDFDPAKTYPLLVYVPGNDGGKVGNLGNARAIAGDSGWIVASLPLFKKVVDRKEPGGGLVVSLEDEPIIAQAYATMLGRVFEMVPQIDKENSAMVGFSNGAITIAVLLSCHDAFVFDHFKNFCLVDHGMFHLTDLHKSGARDCRYLLLAGDEEDLGRELKLRAGQLQEDIWKLVGIDLEFHVMKDTGHEFGPKQMALVGNWLRREPLSE